MLDAFKRLISRAPAPASGPSWKSLSNWARDQDLVFKRVREGEGFAIEGSLDNTPWRLEWGPPQRSYIAQRELRLRMVLDLPDELPMLLLSRGLAESLENATFAQFTQSTQTYADASAPEEMRWLAMFPKASLTAHKELRGRFTLVSSEPELAQAWLAGPLAKQLQKAAPLLLANEPDADRLSLVFSAEQPEPFPLVLICLRGRLYLRLAAPEISADKLAAAVDVFTSAARQVLRVASAPPAAG